MLTTQIHPQDHTMRRPVEFNPGDTVFAYGWPDDIPFTLQASITVDRWPYVILKAPNGDVWRMPKMHVCHYPHHQRKA